MGGSISTSVTTLDTAVCMRTPRSRSYIQCQMSHDQNYMPMHIYHLWVVNVQAYNVATVASIQLRAQESQDQGHIFKVKGCRAKFLISSSHLPIVGSNVYNLATVASITWTQQQAQGSQGQVHISNVKGHRTMFYAHANLLLVGSPHVGLQFSHCDAIT